MKLKNVKYYPATSTLKWEHGYNWCSSERIALLRGGEQTWRRKVNSVCMKIFVIKFYDVVSECITFFNCSVSVWCYI